MKSIGFLLLAFAMCTCALAQNQAQFHYPLPLENQFTRKTVSFAADSSGDLMVDVYRPAGAKGKLSVLLLLNGVGRRLGDGLFRDHPQYAGWGRAATTVGMAGVVMESDEHNPRRSFDTLVSYLRQHSDELGVDPEQMVVWSCSANVRTGMPILTDPKLTNVRAGIVYYGYGDVGTYRLDVPVMVVRAGLDMEMLNRSLDSASAGALKANAPWTTVNYSGGHHGFDLYDDNQQTRDIIGQTLAFAQHAVDPRRQREREASRLQAEAAGLAYSQQWPQAEAAYRRMLESNPSDNMAHWKLAEVLAHANKHREAIEEFQRALALGNGNRGVISLEAAKSAMVLGDRALALKSLDGLRGIRVMIEVMKQDPDFATLRDDPAFLQIIASAQ